MPRLPEALDTKVKAYVEELKNGTDMASVAITEGLIWQQFNDVARSSDQISSLLVQSAFGLPRADASVSYGIAPSFTGDVSIIQVQSVTDANPYEQTSEQRLALSAALTRLRGQADIKLLEGSLNTQAVIETFEPHYGLIRWKKSSLSCFFCVLACSLHILNGINTINVTEVALVVHAKAVNKAIFYV